MGPRTSLREVSREGSGQPLAYGHSLVLDSSGDGYLYAEDRGRRGCCALPVSEGDRPEALLLAEEIGDSTLLRGGIIAPEYPLSTGT